MKGIVFREFADMVEATFSADLLDDIIDRCELASGGAYTTVGTYDHGEMVQLVTQLSVATETPIAELLQAFGGYLFGRFVNLYPHFFNGIDSAIELLAQVESIIHPEVLKLYPDAELPRFHVQEHYEDRLVMDYESSRHLEDLAEGLMLGCIRHFNRPVTLERTQIDGDKVRFTLQAVAG